MKDVVRYERLKGTKAERRAQFEEQLTKFEQDAEEGKVLCLSDLIGNAEELHVGDTK